jgi:hypothetical protein
VRAPADSRHVPVEPENPTFGAGPPDEGLPVQERGKPLWPIVQVTLTESLSFLQSEPTPFYKPPCGRIAVDLEKKKIEFPGVNAVSANRRVDLRRKPGMRQNLVWGRR